MDKACTRGYGHMYLATSTNTQVTTAKFGLYQTINCHWNLICFILRRIQSNIIQPEMIVKAC